MTTLNVWKFDNKFFSFVPHIWNYVRHKYNYNHFIGNTSSIKANYEFEHDSNAEQICCNQNAKKVLLWTLSESGDETDD